MKQSKSTVTSITVLLLCFNKQKITVAAQL